MPASLTAVSGPIAVYSGCIEHHATAAKLRPPVVLARVGGWRPSDVVSDDGGAIGDDETSGLSVDDTGIRSTCSDLATLCAGVDVMGTWAEEGLLQAAIYPTQPSL